MTSTEPIKEWIKASNIKYLAIHLDLDVLDPKAFDLYYSLTLKRLMISLAAGNNGNTATA